LVRFLRLRLARIVGVWLVCQAGVLVATPLSLAVNAEEPALLCTCGTGGPDHDCPMHGKHHHPGATEQQTRDCALGSGNPVSDATLTSLLGGIGLIPPPQAPIPMDAARQPVRVLPAAEILRSDRPDSPPPRPASASIDSSSQF
jgi:hypothetical protein